MNSTPTRSGTDGHIRFCGVRIGEAIMGTQPDYPMPDHGQGYPPVPPEPPTSDGRSLGLAGLIVGIIALVLFWLPLINFVALLLALVGLGLSIASLVIVRRRGSAQGLSVAAVIVSAVALVAAIVATFFWSALFDSIGDEIDNPLSPVTVSPSTSTTDPPSPTPMPADPTPQSSAPTTNTAPDTVLPQGTDAEVGDYDVTVSSVQLDATDAILGFSEFNEPPEGQYVLVTLDVVYTGIGEGNPWIDLTPRFVGSDNRQYSTSTCLVTLDLQAVDVPILENGGAAQYEVCMDVPPAAIPGERVLVEDNTSFDESEASWQTQ